MYNFIVGILNLSIFRFKSFFVLILVFVGTSFFTCDKSEDDESEKPEGDKIAPESSQIEKTAENGLEAKNIPETKNTQIEDSTNPKPTSDSTEDIQESNQASIVESTYRFTSPTLSVEEREDIFLLKSMFKAKKNQIDSFSTTQSHAYVQDGLLKVYASYDAKIGALEHTRRIKYKEQILSMLEKSFKAIKKGSEEELEPFVLPAERGIILRQLNPLLRSLANLDEFRVGAIKDVGTKSKLLLIRVLASNADRHSEVYLQVYVDFVDSQWLISAVEGDANSLSQDRPAPSLFEPSGANAVGSFF